MGCAQALLFLSTVCLFGDDLLAAPLTKSQIYQRLGPSVARVDFAGELYDGTQELSPGTAFLVSSDGLALTCSHVVPPTTNYKSWKLEGRFESLASGRISGEVIWRDQDLDVALVRFPPPPRAKPLVLDAKLAAALTPGTDIVALGFPIDLDLSVSAGTINVRRSDRLWVFDAAINPGHSGGPIIGEDGRIVGVAWGAALRWSAGATSVPLEGIRYFVAADKIWDALPAPEKALLATTFEAPAGEDGVVRIAQTIDITKSNHPVLLQPHSSLYQVPIKAEPGYRILAARSKVFSAANMSGYTLNVAEDGSSAVATFTLKSGPQVDQWRGWLKGTVELEQEKVTETE
jgi:S1-C subfamily serine protease